MTSGGDNFSFSFLQIAFLEEVAGGSNWNCTYLVMGETDFLMIDLLGGSYARAAGVFTPLKICSIFSGDYFLLLTSPSYLTGDVFVSSSPGSAFQESFSSVKLSSSLISFSFWKVTSTIVSIFVC